MSRFLFKISSNASKGPLSKKPILIIILLCILVWLGILGYSFIKLLSDHYFPYEGQVDAIGNSWTDYVTYEHTLWEHLSVRTPQGKEVDKFIGLQNRLSSRIEEGDYVIKLRGFKNYVRPRDKMTTTELLKSTER